MSRPDGPGHLRARSGLLEMATRISRGSVERRTAVKVNLAPLGASSRNRGHRDRGPFCGLSLLLDPAVASVVFTFDKLRSASDTVAACSGCGSSVNISRLEPIENPRLQYSPSQLLLYQDGLRALGSAERQAHSDLQLKYKPQHVDCGASCSVVHGAVQVADQTITGTGTGLDAPPNPSSGRSPRPAVAHLPTPRPRVPDQHPFRRRAHSGHHRHLAPPQDAVAQPLHVAHHVVTTRPPDAPDPGAHRI